MHFSMAVSLRSNRKKYCVQVDFFLRKFYNSAISSALDNVTQKKVSEALDRMKCTRIVIAHRLSTIRQCDRIIVLEKGQIIEDGSYETLIAKNGFFADLVSRQQLDDTGFVGKTTLY